MTETRGDAAAMPARQAWRALAVTIAATAVAMLVDGTVFEFLHAPTVYDKDLGRLLRIMGFAGTWLALALAVGLDQGSAARRCGWLLFWSPTLAGALAELLKIVVRRERPALNAGAYGFREWGERTFSGAGLAFPSSHTAVAFGGAFMLGRLFPRARWIGYLLAAGCGVTRVLARAHFVSDVVFAAGLGWLVSWALWRKWAPRVAAVTLLLALSVPATTQAQQTAPQASPQASPQAVLHLPCLEYERCALGLVASVTGITVVQGANEIPRAKLGFFLPGSSLDQVFAGDSIAQRIGRDALRQRRVGAVLSATTALTFAAAGFLALDSENSWATGALVLGAAQAAAAVRYQFKADNSLSRAVWTFNRRFAR